MSEIKLFADEYAEKYGHLLQDEEIQDASQKDWLSEAENQKKFFKNQRAALNKAEQALRQEVDQLFIEHVQSQLPAFFGEGKWSVYMSDDSVYGKNNFYKDRRAVASVKISDLAPISFRFSVTQVSENLALEAWISSWTVEDFAVGFPYTDDDEIGYRPQVFSGDTDLLTILTEAKEQGVVLDQELKRMEERKNREPATPLVDWIKEADKLLMWNFEERPADQRDFCVNLTIAEAMIAIAQELRRLANASEAQGPF